MVWTRSIGAPTVRGGPGGLHQRGPELGTPLRSFPGLALARRLVMAGTPPRPTRQGPRARQARHLDATLRHNRRRHAPTPGMVASRATASGTQGSGLSSLACWICASTRASAASRSSSRASHAPSPHRWVSVRRPARARTHSGFCRFTGWRAKAALAVALVSPAAKARHRARPLPPRASLAPCPRLLWPLSITCCIRLATALWARSTLER